MGIFTEPPLLPLITVTQTQSIPALRWHTTAIYGLSVPCELWPLHLPDLCWTSTQHCWCPQCCRLQWIQCNQTVMPQSHCYSNLCISVELLIHHLLQSPGSSQKPRPTNNQHSLCFIIASIQPFNPTAEVHVNVLVWCLCSPYMTNAMENRLSIPLIGVQWDSPRAGCRACACGLSNLTPINGIDNWFSITLSRCLSHADIWSRNKYIQDSSCLPLVINMVIGKILTLTLLREMLTPLLYYGT